MRYKKATCVIGVMLLAVLSACGGDGSSSSGSSSSSSSSASSTSSASVSFSPLGSYQATATFTVNTTTAGQQVTPNLTKLADGAVFVLWADDDSATIGGLASGIKAQRLRADGTKIGTEFLISAASEAHAGDSGVLSRRVRRDPYAAVLTDGRIMIAYRAVTNEFSGFSWSGNVVYRFLTTQFQGTGAVVEAGASDSKGMPIAIGMSGGGYAIAYTQYINPPGFLYTSANINLNDPLTGLYGSRSFSAFNEIRSGLSVAPLPNNRVVMIWEEEAPSLVGQVVDIQGGLIGAKFVAGAIAPSIPYAPRTPDVLQRLEPRADAKVSTLSDGGFVVVWQQPSASSDLDIVMQHYAADGSAAGGNVVVNTTTALAQRQAAIATLSDGRVIVAWVSDSSTAGVQSVRAQLFAANGTRIGSEFVVSDPTNTSRAVPSISAVDNGAFVIAWQEGQPADVIARAFKP